MRVLRSWWSGLRPSDRYLASLFSGVIAATTPFYIVAAVVLAAGQAERLTPPDGGSTGPGPAAVAQRPEQTPSLPPAPTPTPSLPNTPAPSPAVQPTAPPSPTDVPPVSPVPATSAPTVSTLAATQTPIARAAPSPVPVPNTAGPAELECHSLPGSVSPGQYVDVVESRARPLPSGELVVEGVIHNNCNRPLRAVVHAEARDGRGARVAARQIDAGGLAPDARGEFQLSLGRLRRPPAVVVVGADKE